MICDNFSHSNGEAQPAFSQGLHPSPTTRNTMPFHPEAPSNNPDASGSRNILSGTRLFKIEPHSTITRATLLSQEDKDETYYAAPARDRASSSPNIIGRAVKPAVNNLKGVTDTQADNRNLTSPVIGNHVPSAFGTLKVELINNFGRYIGEVDPDTQEPQGEGTLYFKEGGIYRGKWRDGAPEGFGEKHYENGDVYRGHWIAGKRSGLGEYFYKDGHYFKGTYEDDKPNGYGVFVAVNHDRYEGMWCNGQKEGKGQEILHDGQKFFGRWRNGKKQGRGRLFLPGTTTSIYGVWNQDEFFRELTFTEMENEFYRNNLGADEVPRNSSETLFHQSSSFKPALDEVAIHSPPAEQGQPSFMENMGSKMITGLMGGLNFIEDRLEALGRVFEQVATPEPPKREMSATHPTAYEHFNEVLTQTYSTPGAPFHRTGIGALDVLKTSEGELVPSPPRAPAAETMSTERQIHGLDEDVRRSASHDALYEMALLEEMSLNEELK